MFRNTLREIRAWYFTGDRLPFVIGEPDIQISRYRAVYPRLKPISNQLFAIVQSHIPGISVKHHFLQFQRRHNIPVLLSKAQQIVRHAI